MPSVSLSKRNFCGVSAVLTREPSILHNHISFMSVIISYSKFTFRKGQNTLAGMLQWQVAATNHHFMCTEEFLWKFCFCNKILLLQQVAKIKSHSICAMCCSNKIVLWRQRFGQKFSSTHNVICHCDVLPGHVAASSPPTCTERVICRCDILLQLVVYCVPTLSGTP